MGRVWVAAEHSISDGGVGVFSNGVVNELTPLFFQTGSAGTQDQGFALDSTEAFYVHYSVFGGQFHNVDKFAGGLTGGVVGPVRELGFASAPLGLGVDPVDSDLFVAVGGGGGVERFAANSGRLVEKFGKGHLGSGGGVAVDRKESVYVADGAGGVVDVFKLEQPGPPTIESQGVLDVSGSSATFVAAMNPRGAQTDVSVCVWALSVA